LTGAKPHLGGVPEVVDVFGKKLVSGKDNIVTNFVGVVW